MHHRAGIYVEEKLPTFSFASAHEHGIVTRDCLVTNMAEGGMGQTKVARASLGPVGLEHEVVTIMMRAFAKCAETAQQCCDSSSRTHAWLTPNVWQKWMISCGEASAVRLCEEIIAGDRYRVNIPAVPHGVLAMVRKAKRMSMMEGV